MLISSTGQSWRSFTAWRNSLLFWLKPKSWRGSTVSHADDPFSVARSNARWVFLGAISLIRSALCSSSFDLSLLTSCCASFVRESSGNWCDWDTIIIIIIIIIIIKRDSFPVWPFVCCVTWPLWHHFPRVRPLIRFLLDMSSWPHKLFRYAIVMDLTSVDRISEPPGVLIKSFLVFYICLGFFSTIVVVEFRYPATPKISHGACFSFRGLFWGLIEGGEFCVSNSHRLVKVIEHWLEIYRNVIPVNVPTSKLTAINNKLKIEYFTPLIARIVTSPFLTLDADSWMLCCQS